MRRTHLIPDKDRELRVLGRAMGPARFADAESISAAIDEVRTRVRALHEDVFYRPIIAATASLSEDEVSLHADGARDRLAAIGYRDPAGALTHVEPSHRARAGARRSSVTCFRCSSRGSPEEPTPTWAC